MKIYTWENILQHHQDILIIGYGSLINENTHHCIHDSVPVIFSGFRRVYNYRACPKNPSTEWKNLFREYLKKYNIETESQFQHHLHNPPCVLNCEYT